MTADALKTMTRPTNTKSSVAMKRVLSTLMRLATNGLHFFLTSLCRSAALRERAHRFFEDAAAMLVVFELIEAGAGRREQDHVSGRGQFGGATHRSFKSLCALDGRGPGNLRFDFFRGSSDGVNPPGALAQQRLEDCVVTVFIFAAEHDVDAGRKRFQR